MNQPAGQGVSIFHHDCLRKLLILPDKQIRKYDQTIRSLKSDKSSLQKQTENLSRQVKEAKSSNIQKKMDDARLRADYENLQHLVNRIPPEILELAKRGQLSHSDRER